MQIIKGQASDQLQRLRLAFHLMAEKNIAFDIAISQVNNLYSEVESKPTHKLTSLFAYQIMQEKSKNEFADQEKLRYAFLNALCNNHKLVSAFWQAMKSVLSYSLSVVICSVIVTVIIGAKVLPVLKANYDEGLASVPEMTQWIMAASEYYWLVALMLITITLSVIAIAQNVRACLFHLRPLSKGLTIFVQASVGGAYHHYLIVQYTIVMVASGVKPEKALSLALECVGERADNPSKALKSNQEMQALWQAGQLGVLERELQFQYEQAEESLANALYIFKQSMNRYVFVAAFLFVGASLMAVYMPIFHFGQTF